MHINHLNVTVAQLCPTPCDPMDYMVHGIRQVRILEQVAFPSPGDLPNPGLEHKSPTLQADSLPAEPPRKPKNTGVSSLSLLQQIFLTQELNQSLLHYRQILYQLGYQGSPHLSWDPPLWSFSRYEIVVTRCWELSPNFGNFAGTQLPEWWKVCKELPLSWGSS